MDNNLNTLELLRLIANLDLSEIRDTYQKFSKQEKFDMYLTCKGIKSTFSEKDSIDLLTWYERWDNFYKDGELFLPILTKKELAKEKADFEKMIIEEKDLDIFYQFSIFLNIKEYHKKILLSRQPKQA